jgi:hypothetical protein
MFLSVLLALTQPSEACGELLKVDSTFPATGTLDVSVDAHFFLEFKCHSFAEEPRFILEQNGKEVAIEITLNQRSISEYSNVMYVEIEPSDILESEATLLLTMDQLGMQTKVATFATSSERALELSEDRPELWWMTVQEVFQTEEQECWGELEDELYFDVKTPEQDDAMIRLYQVDSEFRGQEPTTDLLHTPFHEIHDVEDTVQRNAFIKRASSDEDLCFTATYVNRAGAESSPSLIQCIDDFSYDEWMCSTGMGGMAGCSSMPASELGWLALLMGSFGFVRRRK